MTEAERKAYYRELAKEAMQGLLAGVFARNPQANPADIARVAWAIAEAMLEEMPANAD